MSGRVYLVGAGPGAPDLLTLRAERLLKRADVVFHDALVHPDTVALAARAVRICVGKRHGQRSASQPAINRALVRAARHQALVVRLKGGDPLLFGRAHEEIAALEAAGVAWEVVPGVTAAFAAAAQIGAPLTRRGQARSLTLVTPALGRGEPRADWVRSVLGADGAAIYMGLGEAGRVAEALLSHGLAPATPVAIVEDASLPQSQVLRGTLAGLHRLAAGWRHGPAIILIGAMLSEDLPAQWAEDAASQREAQGPRRRTAFAARLGTG
jgi:uroporphyrin-III C-methyltransferase